MNRNYIILGILIPFIGTSLGSACVYFLKGKKTPGENAPVIKPNLQKGLTGFAAGVMVAASIWSLLIPAMEESGREPVAAVLMLLFAPVFSPLMPYFLSFAAGAMIYVVVEELIPETAEGEH